MFIKWTYIPPLLIYASAGVSGLTNIAGIFFLKDYLNLSAAFIASLGFWVGIPWALKMPVGFLVDRFWKIKNYIVYAGSIIIFFSLLIIYLLLTKRVLMETYLSAENWYIISALLTPIGYVLQDVVADAMTVEAVDYVFKNKKKDKFYDGLIKREHTLLQMYGRFSIILGSLLVSFINLLFFYNMDKMDASSVNDTYSKLYLFSFIIPLISSIGVFFYSIFAKKDQYHKPKKLTSLDLKIFFTSLVFVVAALILGTINFRFSQEIILIISLFLISLLMNFLMRTLDNEKKLTIIGTAIIIFIYRSVPGPGPGINWFEIDVLKFDQSFFSVLSIISASLTLLSIIYFKKFMIKTPISKLFVILSIISALLYLPSIFMVYGIHNITSSLTNGIVDARFIAIINTGVESPIAQIAMIPLLAWIAKNAPNNYKATFFAVFASFTNLALSARELFTKYLNKIFIIKREIIDYTTKELLEKSDYSSLDNLLITVSICTLIVPLSTVYLVQKSKFKSTE